MTGQIPLAPADAALADKVAQLLRDVLGDALLGAYLHGSAVLGGLRASSDLDVLGIVARPTTPAERRSIVRRLLAISGRRAHDGPARPVELTILQAGELKAWRAAPTVELLYGEWLRDIFETGVVPDPAPMPDLGPEIALTLQGDRSLFGPPPRELIDPVPRADLRRSVLAGVPSLIADLETDTRNVLLTFARVWFTLETGRIGSKDEAATWAVEQMPSSDAAVLNLAREMYVDGLADDWANDIDAARGCASFLVARIERLARAATSRPRSERRART